MSNTYEIKPRMMDEKHTKDTKPEKYKQLYWEIIFTD